MASNTKNSSENFIFFLQLVGNWKIFKNGLNKEQNKNFIYTETAILLT